FTAAVRYSDYDTFGSETTPKFGLIWRPFEDLLLRTSYSEAFRAPNVSDLFGGVGSSFPATEDPCAVLPTAFCIADGVPAAGFTPISDQVRTIIGGNPTVSAETADTWTYGMVWTPTGLDLLTGFSLSVDFFDITIDDAISDLGTDFILTSCAETGSNCNLIDRFGAGPNEGNPLLVNNTQNNVGEITGKGMDVEGKYRGIELPRDLGMIDISVRASWLDEYDKEQADGTIISHAGRFIDDQDGYFTEWRVNLDVTYMWRDLLFNYTYRYIGEADESYADRAFTNLQTRTIRSMGYHDVYAQYGWKGVTFSAGLENMLDAEPPLSLDGFNDNTDVRTFDTRGRYYYFAMKYNL
ncbi:MAG: TonB-dependent receptor, partial [Pseudomonadales bacterium]